MAANPYPVAYKPASAVHRPGPAQGTFKPKPLPQLAKLPSLPVPANLNRAAKFTGGFLARRIPYLGLALTAWELYQWYSDQAATLTLGPEWTTACTNGAPWASEQQIVLFDNGPAYACGNWFETAHPFWATETPYSPGAGQVTVFRIDYEDVGAYPASIVERRYLSGEITVEPEHIPARHAYYAPPSPIIRPWLNPEAMPIGQPALVPAPAPGKGLGPEPGQEPDAPAKPTPGAKLNPNPKPPVVTFPAWPVTAPPVWAMPPQVAPVPGAAPAPVAPPVQIVTSPPQPGMKPPVAQARGSSPSNRPPRGSKTHEAKVRQQNLLGKIHAGTLVVVNVATESFDFIDSLYKALPKKRSDTKAEFCDNHDYKCKMAKLWKYRDEIDYAKAWQEYINNQAEDMVFGVMGGQLGKAGHNLGNTTGLNRAIQQNQYGEAPHGLDEDTDEETEESKVGLLPTLTYDRDTGEWGVAWELFGLDSPDVFIPEVKVKR